MRVRGVRGEIRLTRGQYPSPKDEGTERVWYGGNRTEYLKGLVGWGKS